MLGGADPLIAKLVPSDIEFRRNHCFKPLTWRVGDPSYAKHPWTIKNLFELKSAQRVLIDGNLFEQNWTHGQNGYAIVITVRNQDGGAPWSVVQDVTFTNNVVRRVGGGFNLLGQDNNHPSLVSRRIRIANNLFEEVDAQRWSGTGVAFHFSGGGPHDVTIEHNTIFHTGNILAASEKPNEGLVFRNNLFSHNEYGVKGDGRSSGNDSLNAGFPAAVFKKNVLVGGASELYPAENFFPSSFEAVNFVDRSGRNYRLAAKSPYKNAGTDGQDIGCHLEALQDVLIRNKPTSVAAAVP
jgi:hypothetical protein